MDRHSKEHRNEHVRSHHRIKLKKQVREAVLKLIIKQTETRKKKMNCEYNERKKSNMSSTTKRR